MSTYASAADVANYIEGWTPVDVFAIERLLQRSERDLNPLLKPLHNRGLPPTVVISMPGAASGTFVPSYNGQAGAVVPYNDNGAAFTDSLQAAIAADSAITGTSVSGADVIVTGSNPWTVVYSLAFAEKNYLGFIMPKITVDAMGIAPTVVPGIVSVAGLRINPLTDLTADQMLQLSNATCAQFEYRNQMGPDFFVRAQYSAVKGPDFQTTGKLPFVAPKALRELENSGMLFTQGRAVASYGRIGVARGRANY